jgi:hypothetical protein
MPIEQFIHSKMSTTKLSRGIGMKYTRNLVYGNFFQNNISTNDSKWLNGLISLFDLVRVFYLLGFSSALLPFAFAIDTGRLFYYLKIKLSRKLRQFSLIYKFRKNTINLVYRGSRLAYLIIHKTDLFIHLKPRIYGKVL